MSLVGRYAHWLHTRWPAGTVERLPEMQDDGSTAVAGVRIVGDLTGVPLLKFSADSGARAAVGRKLQERHPGQVADDPHTGDSRRAVVLHLGKPLDRAGRPAGVQPVRVAADERHRVRRFYPAPRGSEWG